jgi:hypothetical protein
MAAVNRYRAVLYGSSQDHPGLKAKIELYDQKGETASAIGKLRFHDGELPPDEKKKGMVSMNLPAAQLGTIMDLLRADVPVFLSFHEGRAVLGTGIERTGVRDAARARAAEEDRQEAIEENGSAGDDKAKE